MRGPLFSVGTMRAAALAMTLGVGSCASVAPESVELSYILGQDIESLHQSHRELIARYFEALRKQVDDSIDRIFVPAYINGFVVSGKLMQHAQNQRADLVEAWARIAVAKIDRERQLRLQPVLEAEREARLMVDAAFDKAIRANATITAHLTSVVKTQRSQDEMLASLGLKDMREKLNQSLAGASQKVRRIVGEIEDAKGKTN